MDKIDELLTRGVENIIPNKQALEVVLRSDKKLNLYLGIDPTSTKIHIGHGVPLKKLQAFLDLGHHVTFLIGDFTARVGDTSDKEGERPVLTAKQIEENWQTYKKQAEKILDFSQVKVVHNSEWLQKLDLGDTISLLQNFSFNDFISRELIKKRLNAGAHIRLDEVIYPVMQGYDMYFMDMDLQVSGTDQTFNVQAGRALQKNLRNKETFALTMGFLEGTDGRKMSKTWDNAIWLEDSPEDMFGKIMSLKDELIIQYFTLATTLPLDEIAQIKKELDSGKNPMIVKKTLAHQIVKELNSEESAELAQIQFEMKFQEKNTSEAKIKTVPTPETAIIESDALVSIYGEVSNSEAKRLLDQGAIEWNGQAINKNEKIKVNKGDTLKVGKKRFLRFI